MPVLCGRLSWVLVFFVNSTLAQETDGMQTKIHYLGERQVTRQSPWMG